MMIPTRIHPSTGRRAVTQVPSSRHTQHPEHRLEIDGAPGYVPARDLTAPARALRAPALLAQAPSGPATPPAGASKADLAIERELKRQGDAAGVLLKRGTASEKARALRSISEFAVGSPIEVARFQAAMMLVRHGSASDRKRGLNALTEIAARAADQELRYYAAQFLISGKDADRRKQGLDALYDVSKNRTPEEISCREGGYVIRSVDGENTISPGYDARGEPPQIDRAQEEERAKCKQGFKLILSGEPRQVTDGLRLMEALARSTRDEYLRGRAAQCLLWSDDRGARGHGVAILGDLVRQAASTIVRREARRALMRHDGAQKLLDAGEELLACELAKYEMHHGDEAERRRSSAILTRLSTEAGSGAIRFASAQHLFTNGDPAEKARGLDALARLVMSAREEEVRVSAAGPVLYWGKGDQREWAFTVLVAAAKGSSSRTVQHWAAMHLLSSWDERQWPAIAEAVVQVAGIAREERRRYLFAEYAIRKGNHETWGRAVAILKDLAAKARDEEIRRLSSEALKKHPFPPLIKSAK